MEDKRRPVGVFDSGLGGVSVLRELVSLLPNENYVYFGDSANAPYGVKSESEIMDLSMKGSKRLIDHGVKAIVIGCNTITSVAVKELRAKYPELVIIATEPAIKPAALERPGAVVLVMATDATLRGEKFAELMHRYDDRAKIIKCPCPGLMEFVERGDTKSDELRKYLEERFASVQCEHPDSVVLGCTHYPFVKDMIRSVLGSDVKIFDGAPGIARQLRRRLLEKNLLNDSGQRGKILWENSSHDPGMIERGKRLLLLE